MGIATPVRALARDDDFILFGFFLELIGTDAAQGALVIFGQLFAFIDITANYTYVLFHVVSSIIFMLGCFFIFAAALAGAGKAELAFTDDAAGGVFHGAAQLLRHGDLGKIDNCMATGADEVDMGLYIAVEALDATHGAKALDDALLLKQGQVPVNRGKGDVRVLRLKHFVQGFRRGVSMGASQTGENGVPLAELLAFLFHKLLLFANGYCLHLYSSTSFPICQ